MIEFQQQSKTPPTTTKNRMVLNYDLIDWLTLSCVALARIPNGIVRTVESDRVCVCVCTAVKHGTYVYFFS